MQRLLRGLRQAYAFIMRRPQNSDAPVSSILFILFVLFFRLFVESTQLAAVFAAARWSWWAIWAVIMAAFVGVDSLLGYHGLPTLLRWILAGIFLASWTVIPKPPDRLRVESVGLLLFLVASWEGDGTYTPPRTAWGKVAVGSLAVLTVAIAMFLALLS